MTQIQSSNSVEYFRAVKNKGGMPHNVQRTARPAVNAGERRTGREPMGPWPNYSEAREGLAQPGLWLSIGLTAWPASRLALESQCLYAYRLREGLRAAAPMVDVCNAIAHRAEPMAVGLGPSAAPGPASRGATYLLSMGRRQGCTEAVTGLGRRSVGPA